MSSTRRNVATDAERRLVVQILLKALDARGAQLGEHLIHDSDVAPLLHQLAGDASRTGAQIRTLAPDGTASSANWWLLAYPSFKS